MLPPLLFPKVTQRLKPLFGIHPDYEITCYQHGFETDSIAKFNDHLLSCHPKDQGAAWAGFTSFVIDSAMKAMGSEEAMRVNKTGETRKSRGERGSARTRDWLFVVVMTLVAAFLHFVVGIMP